MSRVILSETDKQVMRMASRLETGGMATFTAYWFAPENEAYKSRKDLLGKSPDQWDLKEDEFVPWIPLPWQIVVAHDSRLDGTIIGGFGCGKTVGLAAVGIFWCCMVPQFKFMDAAPVGWQAKQMFDAAKSLIDWDNREDDPTRVARLVTNVVSRPYPKITFYNGSTMEFMSGDEQGAKIRSWEGDAAVVDEAGQLQDLDELLMNLGSRLRGMVRGRERFGKMVIMSNADYNPELWARFDMGGEDGVPESYYSIMLTTYDNPYLSKGQMDAIERRITDPAKRRQYMMSERPLPKGKEFTPELLALCRDESLDDMMEHGVTNSQVGFVKQDAPRVGTWNWELPADDTRTYILVGDPGQAAPPNRNSPCIMVLDCTTFPLNPATLAAFWWGDGAGSYWPFVYKFEEYWRTYHPMFAAYDGTGVQKGFDELVFAQRGLLVEGLNMQAEKMKMVVALKLLMGKGLVRCPTRIANIWLQLAGWRMPDTKLRQDIASTMFMAAHLLHRLFYIMPDEEEDENKAERDGKRPWRRNPRGLRGERGRSRLRGKKTT